MERLLVLFSRSSCCLARTSRARAPMRYFESGDGDSRSSTCFEFMARLDFAETTLSVLAFYSLFFSLLSRYASPARGEGEPGAEAIVSRLFSSSTVSSSLSPFFTEFLSAMLLLPSVIKKSSENSMSCFVDACMGTKLGSFTLMPKIRFKPFTQRSRSSSVGAYSSKMRSVVLSSNENFQGISVP